MNRTLRRGIFFNLDGTLANSVGVASRVFGNFAVAFGRDAGAAEFAAINGAPVPLIVAKLKRDWALPDKLADLIHRYEMLIDSAFLEVSATAAATEALQAAFHNGWKIGIVTSNAAARSRSWLARRGLMPFIEIVVGGDQVSLGKPQPEPYRVALVRSGCAREASIAVENSLDGARSALAAGLRTFAVAQGRESIEWPETIRLIDGLDELMPELTRQRFRRVAGIR